MNSMCSFMIRRKNDCSARIATRVSLQGSQVKNLRK